MNKQKLLLSLTAAILALILLLCGCQSGEEKKDALPIPIRTTVEASDNSFGARYSFTLGKISKDIGRNLGSLRIELKEENWETLSVGLIDDNGVKYTSYCNHTDSVSFIAAVEDESGKVMNFGCGCGSEQLSDSAYRSSFLRLAALIAVQTGGYSDDSTAFFMGLFQDLLDSEEEALSYGETLYFKSIDEKTTVLMTAPCSEQVMIDKQYKNYSGK